MSKREIRAKRLVAAVLLAISVQMWSAPPLWAAEASVQAETSAAGEAKETKETKNAKAADSETGGEADAGEEETVVVPVIGYSTRSAAGSDYGVMPLADMAVDGALTGVTSINDAKFYADSHDLLLGYDAKSQGTGTVALGSDANAGGQYSTAIGASASATAENSSALGMYARAGFKDSVAIGFSSNATADNMVSFGVTENGGSTWTTRRSLEGIANIDMHGGLTGVTGINNGDFILDVENSRVGIGSGIDLSEDANNGIAIGMNVTVTAGVDGIAIGGASSALATNSIAIGGGAVARAAEGISLGEDAEVGEGHTNSVAIGYRSSTTAANQVSFGQWSSTKNEWTNRRSLAGISDIDMAGNISLGGGLDWYNDDNGKTHWKSNGKGELTGVSSINGVIFHMDVNDDEFVTAIGVDSDARACGTAFGWSARAEGAYGTAVGYVAETDDDWGVALGYNAVVKKMAGTALGANALVSHYNSVAIGSDSATTAENQVAFGKGTVTTVDGKEVVSWSDRRSLAGISDIDMHGNISLGGEWSWNDAGTSYKSNGLGNLTGVIGINGIEFLNYDCGDGPVLAIGSTIGNDSTANSVGLGINNTIEGYSSVSIGVGTNVSGNDATGVGSGVSADGENSVAVGSNAFATADGATAVGSASRVYAEGGSALGYGTSVAAAHTNSVAIGAKSATGAANQVSFGHKVGDRNEYGGSNFTDDLFRSLVNVADIEMHGALTGVTGIDGVTVSGTDASTGLTVGGNAVIGKTDTPFSSTGFAVAKDGAVTAKTVNGATITGTAFNGVTLSTDGKVNGAAITSNSFNGVTLEKGADSHYKVGGVDVTKMQTDVAGKADAATVTALDTRVGKSETDIGTLKTTVGDSSKGLVKDTADLKAAVGDSSKGLVKQVSDVDTAYKAADTVLQGRQRHWRTKRQASAVAAVLLHWKQTPVSAAVV